MAEVRNGVLGRHLTATTQWEAVLTSQLGFTVLLKTVHLFNGSSTAATVTLRIQSPNSPVSAYFPPKEIPANGIDLWEGWTALNPGDQLQVTTTAAGCHVVAVGASLPGFVDPLPAGILLS